VRRSILLVFLAAALPLRAHDFWIEPSTFRPALGAPVTASLRVGQDFLGDPVARSSELIDAFIVRDSAGERPIPGLEGRDPAGIVRIEAAGAAMIGYRSKANPLELPAAKFEQFLADEGFDAIRAARAKRGESGKPDRERFYRYAKALLRTSWRSTQSLTTAPGEPEPAIPDGLNGSSPRRGLRAWEPGASASTSVCLSAVCSK